MDELQTQYPSRPQLQYRSVAQTFREILDTVIWVALLYTLVNLASARFVVEGMSMEPNFHTDDYVLISRVSYLFNEPARGDIVVFHYPNAPQTDYIKRVIGTPGDVVEIRDRLVYVNGEPLDEPYINEPCEFSCQDNVWQVGANQFLVMGDNRNHSSDSRSWGLVDRRFIVGEALLRYWPLQAFGSVKDIAYPNP